MPEKNLVLYASPGEKGRKKKVKIVQYPGRVGKGSFYKWVCKKNAKWVCEGTLECSDAGFFATFYAISFDDFRLPKGNGEAGKYGNRA